MNFTSVNFQVFFQCYTHMAIYDWKGLSHPNGLAEPSYTCRISLQYINKITQLGQSNHTKDFDPNKTRCVPTQQAGVGAPCNANKCEHTHPTLYPTCTHAGLYAIDSRPGSHSQRLLWSLSLLQQLRPGSPLTSRCRIRRWFSPSCVLCKLTQKKKVTFLLYTDCKSGSLHL